MMRTWVLLLVSLTLAGVPSAFAQADHADLARAAYDASALPAPPRSVESALPFITRLLAMLPAGERAGYVRGPAGGENVAPLADGTLVRISRVMYPNGQIYKVLSDAPNGQPQWVPEDVRPDLYVPFTVPPPVVVVPPVSQPPGDLLAQIAALRLELATHEAAEKTERDQAEAFRQSVADKWKHVGVFLAKYAPMVVGAIYAGRATAK